MMKIELLRQTGDAKRPTGSRSWQDLAHNPATQPEKNMTLALRSHAVVDGDHAVTLRAPELKPGATVEVIVLVEQAASDQTGVSFLDVAQDIRIDAPDDYSTNFEDVLYANRSGA